MKFEKNCPSTALISDPLPEAGRQAVIMVGIWALAARNLKIVWPTADGENRGHQKMT